MTCLVPPGVPMKEAPVLELGLVSTVWEIPQVSASGTARRRRLLGTWAVDGVPGSCGSRAAFPRFSNDVASDGTHYDPLRYVCTQVEEGRTSHAHAREEERSNKHEIVPNGKSEEAGI